MNNDINTAAAEKSSADTVETANGAQERKYLFCWDFVGTRERVKKQRAKKSLREARVYVLLLCAVFAVLCGCIGLAVCLGAI